MEIRGQEGRKSTGKKNKCEYTVYIDWKRNIDPLWPTIFALFLSSLLSAAMHKHISFHLINLFFMFGLKDEK